MKIWLINPYGPIPEESWREYSYAMMGRALADAGHEVVWWTSNFSHHFKKFRSSGWQDIQIDSRFTVRLVPTTGYQRNVGFGRIWRDWVFSLRTFWRGRKLPSPDCIVYSESPLTLGFAGQKLAAAFGCPVIYHQMDLWPELIVNAFPERWRKLVSLIFLPVYRSRQSIYRRLDAATGLAAPYLDVVLREAPGLRQRPHQVVYNGIDVAAFRRSMAQAESLPVSLPEKRIGDLWAVFAGSLGPSYDIPTLCDVAELLEGSSCPLHIIIAGDGPYRSTLQQRASRPENTRLHYVGQLAPHQLACLYKACDIGLCAYSSRSNVEMPDKIYDYTAAGLPVINSLRGEVSDVIARNRIGLQYLAGDVGDLHDKLLAMAANRQALLSTAERSRETGAEYDQHVQYAKMTRLVEQVVSMSKR